MRHFVNQNNIGLSFRRQQPSENDLYLFCNDKIIADGYIRSDNKGSESTAPLYLYAEDGSKVPNLDTEIVKQIEVIVGETTPEDIFDYIYAVLHSPTYRTTFAEFLKTDFPRVPYPNDKATFWKLVPLGTKLRQLHLLTDEVVHSPITSFPISGTNTIEKLSYNNNRVYINDTQYWEGVPQSVWEFYIGGYQPAQKYMKDRKGRTLTNAEFENYEQMIVSLSETIKVMEEIDNIWKL